MTLQSLLHSVVTGKFLPSIFAVLLLKFNFKFPSYLFGFLVAPLARCEARLK